MVIYFFYVEKFLKYYDYNIVNNKLYDKMRLKFSYFVLLC